MEHHPRVISPLVATAAAIALGGCATSLGDNLGADVVASGSTIELQWDGQHGWSSQLGSRGGQLVAEYDAGYGLVREVIASARPSGQRTLAFPLPEALKGAPTGNVCLYIQLPANNALLPVRKASAGQDTARFRYPAWEKKVELNSRARQAAADAFVLEQNLAAISAQRKALAQAMEQRGVGIAGACEQLPARTSSAPERAPIGVLPQSQHDGAARQVCIHRMAYGRTLFISALAAAAPEKKLGILAAGGGMAVAAPEAAEELVKIAPGSDGTTPAALRERQQQAKALTEDWKRYFSTVGKDYYPPVGKHDDYLPTIGESSQANTFLLLKLFGPKVGVTAEAKTPEPRDLFGALGALMDAYSGCVDDNKRQLKINLDSWTALQTASPERERRIREHFARECRGDQDRLSALIARETKAADDLAAARSQLNRGASGSNVVLGSSKTSLNRLRCDG